MVERARVEDAGAIAHLHRDTIFEGFLSKLGSGFLTSLYRFIIRRERVFVYRENERVLGFVSLSEDPKGLLRRFAFSSPASVFRIILILIRRPHFLLPMLETGMATFLSFFRNGPIKMSKGQRVDGLKGKKGDWLPEVELLSLAVDQDFQNAGIGTKLLETLEEYLKESKIKVYRVIVGEGLESANNFYKKHGFVFATTVKIHGKKESFVYLKELKS